MALKIWTFGCIKLAETLQGETCHRFDCDSSKSDQLKHVLEENFNFPLLEEIEPVNHDACGKISTPSLGGGL